jgi:hypothetical protein
MKNWTAATTSIQTTLATIDPITLVPIVDTITAKGIDVEYAWVFLELCIIFVLNEEELDFTSSEHFEKAIEYWDAAVPGYKYAYSTINAIRGNERTRLLTLYDAVAGDIVVIRTRLQFEIDMSLYVMTRRPIYTSSVSRPSLLFVSTPSSFFVSFATMGSDINQ